MLLSLDDLQHYLDLSHNVVRDLVTEGELPATVVGKRGQYRVRAADLAGYLADEATETAWFKKQVEAGASEEELRAAIWAEHVADIEKFFANKSPSFVDDEMIVHPDA